MKIKKGILSLVLACALALGLMPCMSMAAQAEEMIPRSVSSDYGLVNNAGHGEMAPDMNWAGLQSAFREGGIISLSHDFTAGTGDSALTIPSDVEVTLDLNGYSIDRHLTSAAANGNVITVNGTLKITDRSTAQTGTITGANNSGSGGAIINNGRLTVSSGTISGNRAQEAGAVINNAGSVLTITGGTFENNTSLADGGAFINHGTISMSGGSVQNNTAEMNGGGIWSDGTLTVTKGSISNNISQQNGGAVYINGAGSMTTISGGTITGNKA